MRSLCLARSQQAQRLQHAAGWPAAVDRCFAPGGWLGAPLRPLRSVLLSHAACERTPKHYNKTPFTARPDLRDVQPWACSTSSAWAGVSGCQQSSSGRCMGAGPGGGTLLRCTHNLGCPATAVRLCAVLWAVLVSARAAAGGHTHTGWPLPRSRCTAQMQGPRRCANSAVEMRQADCSAAQPAV